MSQDPKSLLENPPGRVLVVFPNWIGDAIMAMPTLRALRTNLPDTKITVMLRRYAAGIVEGAPWHDDVIEYDSKRKTTLRLRMGVRTIKERRFDIAIILPNSVSSAILMRLAKVPRRVGYSRNARGILLTDPLPYEKEHGRFKPSYMVDYYLNILDYLALDTSERRIMLFTTLQGEERALELMRKYGVNPDEPFIVVNPGAAFGSSKLWPAEYFSKLADLIIERLGLQILLVPGPNEEDIANSIARSMNHECRTLRGAEGGVHVLKSIIRRARMLITNDTGARHIAVAFEVPVVTIMGPTDPRYTNSPYEIGALVRAGVDCSPCHLKKCPSDHRCMREILPGMVFERVSEILEQCNPRNFLTLR